MYTTYANQFYPQLAKNIHHLPKSATLSGTTTGITFGDTHAGTTNVLAYLAQENLVDIPEETAINLDKINESTYLVQMDTAYVNLKKTLDALNQANWADKDLTICAIQQVQLAQKTYAALKSLAQKNMEDLDLTLQSIQKKNPNKQHVLNIGDDKGDRNRTDYNPLALEAHLETLNIITHALISNHGVELLYILLTQQWNRLKSSGNKCFLFEFNDQVASLKGLILALKHGLFSPDAMEQLNQRLTRWVNHLHLITYTKRSQSDKHSPRLMPYTHAPVGWETLFGLAQLFHVPYDRNVVKTTMDNATDFFDCLMRAFRYSIVLALGGQAPQGIPNFTELLQNIQSINFFQWDTSPMKSCRQLELQYKKNPLFALYDLFWSRKPLDPLDIPTHLDDGTELIYVHGHHTYKAAHTPPTHLISLNNTFGSPWDTAPSHYVFLNNHYLSWEEFNTLDFSHAPDNTCYFTATIIHHVLTLHYVVKSSTGACRDENSTIVHYPLPTQYFSGTNVPSTSERAQKMSTYSLIHHYLFNLAQGISPTASITAKQCNAFLSTAIGSLVQTLALHIYQDQNILRAAPYTRLEAHDRLPSVLSENITHEYRIESTSIPTINFHEYDAIMERVESTIQQITRLSPDDSNIPTLKQSVIHILFCIAQCEPEMPLFTDRLQADASITYDHCVAIVLTEIQFRQHNISDDLIVSRILTASLRGERSSSPTFPTQPTEAILGSMLRKSKTSAPMSPDEKKYGDMYQKLLDFGFNDAYALKIVYCDSKKQEGEETLYACFQQFSSFSSDCVSKFSCK